MKKTFILLLMFIIILSISFSGCLKFRNEREEMIRLGVGLPLNFSEVEKINVSKVEKDLKEINMTFVNISNEIPPLWYEIYRPHYITIDIETYIEINNTRSSYLTASLSGYFPKSQLEENKQYVINEVNKITKLCNLTIDWNKAEWRVSYEEDD